MQASLKAQNFGCPRCGVAPGENCLNVGGRISHRGGPAYHLARLGAVYGFSVFDFDDDSYLTWLMVNPYGYVLNSFQTSDLNSRLHRASCSTISGTPPSGEPPHVWTGTHTKVCSPSKRELEQWVVGEPNGREPFICLRCNP